MHRRDLLRSLGIAAIARSAPAAESEKSLILLTAKEAESLRAHLGKSEHVRALADAAAKRGPWSVTEHRPEGMSIAPNDYYSEGPYWWPDPKNPGGPYVRRDGERNPGRFVHNHDDLGAMGTTLLALGMGAYFLREKRYAEHAGQILSTWFLDAKTRMNPNLEYGQAVRGHNTGRGTGIIDTVSLIYAVQGIALVEAVESLDRDVGAGLRRWFGDYLNWMRTSEKGRDEEKSGNNHATWWAAQAAAHALFTGDAVAQKAVWDLYRSYLVPHEIQKDGSCPREEARTQSLSYSTFNLDAFAVLCRQAQCAGVDLWHFRTAEGVGVQTAIDYLMPYVLEPAKWKKQQITAFAPDRIVFPGLAAVGLSSDSLLKTHKGLPRAANSPWVAFVDLIVRG